MPNQVNRTSRRKVFDFSGLWAGSQQEQRLEASMARSEGQSTAVPTAPDLCFRLWRAKPACGTSASGAAPGSCRAGCHPFICSGTCKGLPVCVCRKGTAAGLGKGWAAPLSIPPCFCPAVTGKRLSTATEALQSTPCEFIFTLCCLTHLTSDAKLLLHTGAPADPRKNRTPPSHTECKQDPCYNSANSSA